eukprot:g64.t1
MKSEREDNTNIPSVEDDSKEEKNEVPSASNEVFDFLYKDGLRKIKERDAKRKKHLRDKLAKENEEILGYFVPTTNSSKKRRRPKENSKSHSNVTKRKVFFVKEAFNVTVSMDNEKEWLAFNRQEGGENGKYPDNRKPVKTPETSNTGEKLLTVAERGEDTSKTIGEVVTAVDKKELESEKEKDVEQQYSALDLEIGSRVYFIKRVKEKGTREVVLSNSDKKEKGQQQFVLVENVETGEVGLCPSRCLDWRSLGRLYYNGLKNIRKQDNERSKQRNILSKECTFTPHLFRRSNPRENGTTTTTTTGISNNNKIIHHLHNQKMKEKQISSKRRTTTIATGKVPSSLFPMTPSPPSKLKKKTLHRGYQRNTHRRVYNQKTPLGQHVDHHNTQTLLRKLKLNSNDGEEIIDENGDENVEQKRSKLQQRILFDGIKLVRLEQKLLELTVEKMESRLALHLNRLEDELATVSSNEHTTNITAVPFLDNKNNGSPYSHLHESSGTFHSSTAKFASIATLRGLQTYLESREMDTYRYQARNDIQKLYHAEDEDKDEEGAKEITTNGDSTDKIPFTLDKISGDNLPIVTSSSMASDIDLARPSPHHILQNDLQSLRQQIAIVEDDIEDMFPAESIVDFGV